MTREEIFEITGIKIERKRIESDVYKLKNEIACFLLKKADDWDDNDLRDKAVELIGEKEVIMRKIELGLELWNEDKSYIKDNIR